MFCKDCWKIFGLFFVVSLVAFSWSGVAPEILNTLSGDITGHVVEDITNSDSFTIQLKQGWNIVSVPFKDSEISGCEDYPAIHYDSDLEYKDENGNMQIGNYEDWIDIKEMKYGKGYWVYADEECSLSFKGTQLVEIQDIESGELKTGINHAGATTEAYNLADYKGTCEINNIYEYDSEKLQTDEEGNAIIDEEGTEVHGAYIMYSSGDDLDFFYFSPGKGYWIDVSDDCKLSDSFTEIEPVKKGDGLKITAETINLEEDYLELDSKGYVYGTSNSESEFYIKYSKDYKTWKKLKVPKAGITAPEGYEDISRMVILDTLEDESGRTYMTAYLRTEYAKTESTQTGSSFTSTTISSEKDTLYFITNDDGELTLKKIYEFPEVDTSITCTMITSSYSYSCTGTQSYLPMFYMRKNDNDKRVYIYFSKAPKVTLTSEGGSQFLKSEYSTLMYSDDGNSWQSADLGKLNDKIMPVEMIAGINEVYFYGPLRIDLQSGKEDWGFDEYFVKYTNNNGQAALSEPSLPFNYLANQVIIDKDGYMHALLADKKDFSEIKYQKYSFKDKRLLQEKSMKELLNSQNVNTQDLAIRYWMVIDAEGNPYIIVDKFSYSPFVISKEKDSQEIYLVSYDKLDDAWTFDQIVNIDGSDYSMLKVFNKKFNKDEGLLFALDTTQFGFTGSVKPTIHMVKVKWKEGNNEVLKIENVQS